MTHTFTRIGFVALVIAGAVAVTQAQAPQGSSDTDAPQRPRVAQRGPQPPQALLRRPALQRGQVGAQRQGRRGGAVGLPGPRGPRQGAMRGGGPGRRGGPDAALRGLGLSEAQQAQVSAIHEKARQEVEALLTPEQLEQLKNRPRRGGRGGGGGLPDDGGR